MLTAMPTPATEDTSNATTAPRSLSPVPDAARWGCLGWGVLGGAALWTALPPVDWGPVAWIAPAVWAWLARRESLPGRRPYAQLWLAGLLFWLATTWWLVLPHWATSIGWVALSAYLAVYLPLFVGLTRVAVHRGRVPLCLAAPVVWTGLEWLRGTLLSGFALAALGHTQHRWTEVIQIADLAGGALVSFLVMLVAACVAQAVPQGEVRWSIRPLLVAAAALAAAWGYGRTRVAALDRVAPEFPGIQVGLIQGAFDTTFEFAPQRPQEIYDAYCRLSQQALRDHPEIDVLVWPETMYGFSYAMLKPGTDADDPGLPSGLRDNIAFSESGLRQTWRALNAQRAEPAAWLVGIDLRPFEVVDGSLREDQHNSALFVDSQGDLAGHYDKMHPVMFGEYIPGGDWFPALYSITPLPRGLTPGERPRAFEVQGVRLAPNICYESTVPRVLRSHVRRLRAEGAEPHALVNLTNDGWFWGSSVLDLHLICSQFRAVELRKPVVIAANTGLSAHIDAAGRRVQVGPRRAEGRLVATIAPVLHASPYLLIGDWPAMACAVSCGALAGWGWRLRRRQRPAK